MSNKNNHLKKIKITNFRGLRDMSLDNLGLVNVLVGGNNVGKTTVLEAVFLLANMGLGHAFVLLQNLRGEKVSIPQNLRYFLDLNNLNNGMEISCVSKDSKTRTIKAKYTYDETASINQNARSFSDISALNYANNFSVECKTTNGKTKNEHHYNFLETASAVTTEAGYTTPAPTVNMIKNHPEKMTPFKIPLFYNHKRLAMGEKSINKLILNKKDDILINIMQKMDKRINSIRYVDKDLFVDIGYPELLPINMLGDGIVHAMFILSFLIGERRLILLDQIEDGLHHTAPEPLLKAILELAQKENKQIFITTHSNEMLQKFKAVLDEQKDMQDKFCLYALQRDKDDLVRSYRYSYSQFESSISTELEIR